MLMFCCNTVIHTKWIYTGTGQNIYIKAELAKLLVFVSGGGMSISWFSFSSESEELFFGSELLIYPVVFSWMVAKGKENMTWLSRRKVERIKSKKKLIIASVTFNFRFESCEDWRDSLSNIDHSLRPFPTHKTL